MAAAALVPGAAAKASGAADTYVNFRTPSGNIGCGYSQFEGETAMLRCEVASHLKPVPKQSGRCSEGVWGRAVAMKPTGAVRPLCISDTVLETTAPVLAYGRTWKRGSFTCSSRSAGLTCRNGSGHGWFLSRALARLF
jgi:hypothetical protein